MKLTPDHSFWNEERWWLFISDAGAESVYRLTGKGITEFMEEISLVEFPPTIYALYSAGEPVTLPKEESHGDE